jgi:DNA polymerase elongation subunit (family B)
MTLNSRLKEIAALRPAPVKAPKILTIDIETSPNVAYVWGLWDQNVSTSQLIEPSRVLCFAAKWLDSAKVEFYSEYHDGRAEMIRQAWRLFDEADVVVTYNGVRFDNPHLMREFVLAGMTAPSPFQNIDLLQVNKRQFKFVSNKLDYVTGALGLDRKIDTGGQQLWNDVLKNDAKAWAKFKRYNVQDVRITEQLFVLLSPWIKGPHRGLWTGDLATCHACGSNKLTHDGFVYSRTAVHPKVLCECGAWSRVLRNGVARPV